MACRDLRAEPTASVGGGGAACAEYGPSRTRTSTSLDTVDSVANRKGTLWWAFKGLTSSHHTVKPAATNCWIL